MPFLAMVADRSSSSIPKVVIASAPHTSYSIPLPSHRFRCLPAGRSSHASGFPRLRTCIHRLFRHAFSGTCNKDFPRLWTQLAGRPRNRYSAGIRSFRSTSPPFLIGVLRRHAPAAQGHRSWYRLGNLHNERGGVQEAHGSRAPRRLWVASTLLEWSQRKAPSIDVISVL